MSLAYVAAKLFVNMFIFYIFYILDFAILDLFSTYKKMQSLFFLIFMIFKVRIKWKINFVICDIWAYTIIVWPEIILVIALVSKIQDGLHFCKVKLLDLGPDCTTPPPPRG